MTRNAKDAILISIMVLIMLMLIGYTVYRVEMHKIELARMAEEQDRIEKLEQELLEQQQKMREARLEELKKEKEKNAADIIDFHMKYVRINNRFYEAISSISTQMNPKAVNIEEIKLLTKQRLEATKNYILAIDSIHIPAMLNKFHANLLEFLEHDYNTWSLTFAYYNSKHYSTYDRSEIDAMHQENNVLLNNAKEELRKVYEKYELGDLLAEIK